LGLPPKSRSKADGGKTSLLAVLPCQDGYVGISPRQQDQWERMVEIMDSPEWAQDEKFLTEQSRLNHWDELEPLLAAWTGSLNKDDVYRLCQSTRIPSFPLNNAGDLFESVQFKARKFFVEADHPVAGKLKYPTWPFQLGSGHTVNITSAPLLGQNNSDLI
jgi:crotonobetainyl-CoA:carnitine CoA-transferase CaiB-like acyl-CoA transferase